MKKQQFLSRYATIPTVSLTHTTMIISENKSKGLTQVGKGSDEKLPRNMHEYDINVEMLRPARLYFDCGEGNDGISRE